MNLGIIGAGGLAQEIFHLLENRQIKVDHFIDTTLTDKSSYLDVPIYSSIQKNTKYIIGIGNPKIKEKFQKLLGLDKLADPFVLTEHVFGKNKIEKGVVVFPTAIVDCNVEIKSSSIIYFNSSITHNCVIGSGVQVSPNVVICGGTKIGDRTFLGAGTLIREKINIVSDCIIGIGSVVVKDIIEPGVYFGNPLKKHL